MIIEIPRVLVNCVELEMTMSDEGDHTGLRHGFTLFQPLVADLVCLSDMISSPLVLR